MLLSTPKTPTAMRSDVGDHEGSVHRPVTPVCRRKMTCSASAVDIRNQELVFVFVLNRAAVNHTLAIRREGDCAGDITQNRARLPAQSGHAVEINVVGIGWIGVVVVEIVAIGRECGTSPEETGLRGNDCDFTAGGYLFDAQTALAFAPAVGQQAAVGGNAGEIDDLSVFGERADTQIPSIDGGRTLAEEFVDAECTCEGEPYNCERGYHQNAFVAACFGDQDG